MFCTNCGANIPDGSKFCPQCGAKIEVNKQTEDQAESQQAESGEPVQEDQTDTSTETSQQPSSGNQPGNTDGNSKKRLSNRTIGIIVAAAVVVVAVIVLIIALSGGGNTIKLDDYVVITVSGSDGYGRAMAEIDKDAIIEDYKGELKWKDESDLETSALKLFFSDPVDALVDSLYGSLDETSGLSNGDTIHFIWNIDAEDIESQIKVKLDYSDFEYKVSDLGDIETYDAFADVTVEFAGISPEADALLTVKDNYLGESAYTLDKSEGLAIGDTVTVTISEDAAEDLLEDKGIYPAEMSHTYTVEDVSYYAKSVDEIPDDAMEKMKTEADDLFRSYAARDWDPDILELRDTEFIGTYFLYRKDGVEGGNVNKIYLIYKVQATIYNTNEDDTLTGNDLDYYIYVAFFDGIVATDGDFSINYTDNDHPWNKSEYSDDYMAFDGNYNWKSIDLKVTIPGALNLDEMFSKLVTTQIDNYTYENTVGEAQAETEEQPEEEN